MLSCQLQPRIVHGVHSADDAGSCSYFEIYHSAQLREPRWEKAWARLKVLHWKYASMLLATTQSHDFI